MNFSHVLLEPWQILVVCAFSGALWIAAKALYTYFSHDRTTIYRARHFRETVSLFKSHARTLDEHSNEYAAVFNGNEWHSLVSTLNNLASLDQEIRVLLQRKEIDSARKLLEEIYGAETSTETTEPKPLRAAVPWEQSVNAMLKNVVHNLEIATAETRQISTLTRSRKRQPTLVTLADLKKSLIESEKFN